MTDKNHSSVAEKNVLKWLARMYYHKLTADFISVTCKNPLKWHELHQNDRFNAVMLERRVH